MIFQVKWLFCKASFSRIDKPYVPRILYPGNVAIAYMRSDGLQLPNVFDLKVALNPRWLFDASLVNCTNMYCCVLAYGHGAVVYVPDIVAISTALPSTPSYRRSASFELYV